MKLHHYILTGILLLLIGMAGGVILMLLNEQEPGFTPTEVQLTEVKRSSSPPEVNAPSAGLGGFSVREVAEKVVPTVVYIETRMAARQLMPDDGNHDMEEEFWERFMPRGRPNAVGSGVLISPDGFILTNNHVVAGGQDIQVTLDDKRQFDARIVGRDPSTDLAVLKVEGEELPHVVLGDSDHVAVGDWVMAVGNPLRLRSTITAGIVSAKSRDVQIINDRMRIESFIQTDAAINKGNSGGALVNTAGELVGINTAIATDNGMNQGYGFAIPINMAFKIGRDLMEFGEVRRAFMGVQIVGVDQRRALELGMESIRGVEIAETLSGGAAEQSGLQAGDVVLQVNGRTVNEANELQAEVALFRPDESVELKIWRDGEEFDTELVLEGLNDDALADSWSQPAPSQSAPPPETPPEEDEDMRMPYESPGEQGNMRSFDKGFMLEQRLIEGHQDMGEQLIVTDVKRYSAAQRAGMRAQDIVMSVNGSRVRSLADVAAELRDYQNNSERGENGANGLSIMVMRGMDILQLEL